MTSVDMASHPLGKCRVPICRASSSMSEVCVCKLDEFLCLRIVGHRKATRMAQIVTRDGTSVCCSKRLWIRSLVLAVSTSGND